MEQNIIYKSLLSNLVFFYKSSIAIWKVASSTLYSITINPDIISCYYLETLIQCITKVDFTKNIGNIFSGSKQKAISKYLNCFNSI